MCSTPKRSGHTRSNTADTFGLLSEMPPEKIAEFVACANAAEARRRNKQLKSKKEAKKNWLSWLCWD